MITLVQGGLIRVMIPKIGLNRTVYFGLSLMAIGFAGFSLSNTGWLMYLFILPFSMGGLAMPALRSIMSNHSREFGRHRPQARSDPDGGAAGAFEAF